MDALIEQVFADLKNRGFKILERINERTFVAEKKDKYLFHVLIEGIEVPIRELYHIINMGESLSLPVIFVLVSNDGVVTYYLAHKLRLPKNPHAKTI